MRKNMKKKNQTAQGMNIKNTIFENNIIARALNILNYTNY